MTKTPYYYVLLVKYIPWTDKKPSRIKITCVRTNQTAFITMANSTGNDACDMAEHWLKDQGFNIIGHAEGKKQYYVFTDTFKELKPGK